MKQNVEKRASAAKAIEYVKKDMVIGIGTGTTISYFLDGLANLVKQGCHFYGIASSGVTEKAALERKIPLLRFDEVSRIDLSFDGVDELDSQFNAIKGGGGALLREKLNVLISDKVIWMLDSSKLVDSLGRFPLPVEVVPYAMPFVIKEIGKSKVDAHPRRIDDKLFLTDNGNTIIDVSYGRIDEPELLYSHLKNMTGVVEVGLFINSCDLAIVGKGERTEVMSNLRRKQDS
jgi:ribose 5-phosphate isomerase A